MAKSTNTSGATLIELLVVITLMMSMLALMAGVIIDNVAKSKSQAEVILVSNLLKKASVKAFATGNIVTLSFIDNRCELEVDERVTFTHIFDFLSFESLQIKIERNGLPDRYSVNARVRGVTKKLDFAPVFREFGLDGYVSG